MNLQKTEILDHGNCKVARLCGKVAHVNDVSPRTVPRSAIVLHYWGERADEVRRLAITSIRLVSASLAKFRRCLCEPFIQCPKRNAFNKG